MNGSNYELGPLCGSTDIETLEKARSAITAFFKHIQDANLPQWEIGRAGYLCTNVAVQAYIFLLSALIEYWEGNTATDPREMEAEEVIMELEEYMQPLLDFLSKASDEKIEQTFKVPFGSGGPPEYFFRLCRIVKERFPDFEPAGMEAWEAGQSEENIVDADRKLKEIVVLVQKRIFEVLRRLHGEHNDAYWHRGISDKAIKAKAYERSLDYEDQDRLALENYLDVIDYKKIVESKQNWGVFKDVFDSPDPGDKGHAKNVRWMDRINELRRISAHPSKERGYKVEDFAYLDFVHQRLNENLRDAPDPSQINPAADPNSGA
jgi:DNA sulfur modification protein DndB